MKHFKAIAAMSLNRAIGKDNRIPWQLPEDLGWFKKLTTGHIVVMGRKTFESLGKPLPDRRILVLSRTAKEFPGAEAISDLSQIDPKKEERDVFICGGAQVYEQALPRCSDLYLTLVKRQVEGDTFFPAFEEQFVFATLILEKPEFKIVHYMSRTLI